MKDLDKKPVYLVIIILITASLVPTSTLFAAIPLNIFPILHIIGYAALSHAILYTKKPETIIGVIGVIIATFLIGAVIEIAQIPARDRMFSNIDLVYNAIGALTVFPTYIYTHRG